MVKSLFYILITTLVVRDLCAIPATYVKGDISPRNTLNKDLQSKLTKLRQLLKDLEEEENLLTNENIPADNPNHPLKTSPDQKSPSDDSNYQPEVPTDNPDHEPGVTSKGESSEQAAHNKDPIDLKIAAVHENNDEDVKQDAIYENIARDDDNEDIVDDVEEAKQGEPIRSGTVYKHLKDVAMKRFLDSLSPESLKDLEIIKRLTKESELTEDIQQTEDKQLPLEPETKTKTKGTYYEHALTDSEINEANWRNLVNQLENQRDQLIVQKQIKSKGNGRQKIVPYQNNGVFGKFNNEVKTAVEKNLLSDVSLAMHSGISIDDLIADIMGKEEGAKM